MRINIEQQRAQIDIDIQQAKLRLRMPERQMEISQVRPEMTVSREEPEVRLDMDGLKANMGLKTNDQLLTDAVRKAEAEARQGVRDIVNLSDFLGDVTVEGNRIAIAAKDQLLAYQSPDMGRSPVPPNVEMDGKPGKLEIEWTDSQLSIDWTGDFMPEFYVEPPCSVNVEISQPPSVKISVEEVYIPAASGRNVNTEA
jgi:hypothetical protein